MFLWIFKWLKTNSTIFLDFFLRFYIHPPNTTGHTPQNCILFSYSWMRLFKVFIKHQFFFDHFRSHPSTVIFETTVRRGDHSDIQAEGRPGDPYSNTIYRMRPQYDQAHNQNSLHRNGSTISGQWIFSSFERDSGDIFMVPVEKRDTTLLPVIEHRILPGTTIHSDYSKVYDCLDDEGFNHLKPFSRIRLSWKWSMYTNNIEDTWRVAKKHCDTGGRKKVFRMPPSQIHVPTQ